ncbi:MAG TPA: dihydroorotate dehydrogenase electron transfer subunit [Actinomycetota bacterium]|nr:dihydroorotate dehydrogenase electron transfer subunit [Actinomycetota bacterium]
MIVHQTAEVLSYRKLGDEYHLLTIVAPEIAESAKPGQFVNLRPPADRSFILRRPFSIYRVNRRGDWAATIEVVFDIRGGGTSALASLRPHDMVDLVGPVGRPFTIPSRQHSCLLIGGGVGAVPLFFLAEELRAVDKRVDVLWGAATASRLVNPIDAKRLGAMSSFTTDDGSEGHKGLVTDLLPDMIERCGTEVIYACGPHAMLAAVTKVAIKHRVPIQVATEALMGCGIGICMTCVQPIWNKDGTEVMNVRTCIDGPVFNGARVAWDAHAPSTLAPVPPGN